MGVESNQVFMERVILEDNVFIGPHTVFSDDAQNELPKAHVESFVSIGAKSHQELGLVITRKFWRNSFYQI